MISGYDVKHLDTEVENLATLWIGKLRPDVQKFFVPSHVAVVGYHSTRGTKGGILVIGFNGHKDKEEKKSKNGKDWEKYSEDVATRRTSGYDELLDEHPYFKAFTGS